MKYLLFILSILLFSLGAHAVEELPLPGLLEPSEFRPSLATHMANLSDLPHGTSASIVIEIEYIAKSDLFGEIKTPVDVEVQAKSMADLDQKVNEWQKKNGTLGKVTGFVMTMEDSDGNPLYGRGTEFFSGEVGAREYARRAGVNLDNFDEIFDSKVVQRMSDDDYIRRHSAPDPMNVLKMKILTGEIRNIRFALGALAPTAAAAFAGGLALTAPDQSMAAAPELTEDETRSVGIGQ